MKYPLSTRCTHPGLGTPSTNECLRRCSGGHSCSLLAGMRREQQSTCAPIRRMRMPQADRSIIDEFEAQIGKQVSQPARHCPARHVCVRARALARVLK